MDSCCCFFFPRGRFWPITHSNTERGAMVASRLDKE
jgi:hypothetical protein